MQTHDQGSLIRPDIQALRALAVFVVMVCHMNPAWLPGGYLGVDIFFVISGFVITQAYTESYRKKSIAMFWLVRLLRIAPAYIAMLTLTALAASVLYPYGLLSQFGKSWISGLLFISNNYFANYGDYFSPELAEQPLLHTWSLAIEMQFYLIYPLLLRYVKKSQSFTFLLALTVAGFFAAQLYWSFAEIPSKLYYSLLIRIPEFLMGATLVFLYKNLDPTWGSRFASYLVGGGLAVVLFAVCFISESVFSPLTVGLTCLGACSIILAGQKTGWWNTFLNHPILSKGGYLSYSIYLWHWPLLAFYRYAFGEIAWSLTLVVSYIACVILMAWMSFEVIENKFRYKTDHSMCMTLSKIGIVTAVAISPGVFAKPVNAIIPDLPIKYARYADDSSICHGRLLPNCVRGEEGRIDYLLIGDSHAAQLNIAANYAGHVLNTGIEVLSASSCVPLPKFNVDKLPAWAKDDCKTQIKVVSDRLKDGQKIILAGMWSYQFQDPTFPDALRDFLEFAKQHGDHVLVLGQVPKLNKHPGRLMRMKNFGVETSISIGNDWKVANSALFAILNEFPAVKYFDPSLDLLFSNPPYYEQSLIYSDDHHLNEVGAEYYGQVLARQIKINFQE